MGKAPLNYIASALVTKSDKFYPEKVSFEHFCDALSTAIAAMQDLDRIKKALFYGKVPEGFNLSSETLTCVQLPTEAFSPNEDVVEGIDTLHAVIGIATEAGELLEALQLAMFSDDGYDVVNLAEEIGDVFWYQAILAKVLGKSFAEIQQTNIDKLRARFGDKFSEFDANNRNLFEERMVLEGHTFLLDELSDKISQTELAQGLISLPTKFDLIGKCDKAPEGWKCTRGHGHNGPCAADKLNDTNFVKGDNKPNK